MHSKKLIYIASPYTGCEAIGVRRQMDAHHRIMDMGHLAYAPLLCHFAEIQQDRPYQEWLDHGLHMVRRCDAVLRLAGSSQGADLEVATAVANDLPVLHSLTALNDWLKDAKEK